MALAPDPPLLTTLIIINIDLIIVEISEVKITDHMMKEENTDTGQTYIMSTAVLQSLQSSIEKRSAQAAREEVGLYVS